MLISLDTINSAQLVLLDTISGSHAYGLNTPTSDVDIRGIFMIPAENLFGLQYKEQVNDNKNDIVFYELGRFFQLALKNNPNILELLATPEDCIRYRHPLMERLKPEMFLSKLCRDTFAGYARAQISKAHGLKKKIVNPVAEERKTPLDFCYVVEGQGAIPVSEWLAEKGWQQENCGLVNIPHMREVYALFYDESAGLGFKGIIQKPTSNSISLSSIPKEMKKVAVLSFNKDGYQIYCKDYKAYWEWVEKRNEARYEKTLSHGKNYDSKNMMHTFRLLAMSGEIAREGKLFVRRNDRDFLLKIRNGEFDYADLVELADEKLAQIDELYENAPLPDQPDREFAERTLISLRQDFYQLRNLPTVS